VCDYVHLNPARGKLVGKEDRLSAYPPTRLPLQGEAEGLGLLDELNPAERRRRIEPVIRAGTVCLGQQAKPFVVMQRLQAHVGAGREFTNLQERFRLHLPRKLDRTQVVGKTGGFAPL